MHHGSFRKHWLDGRATYMKPVLCCINLLALVANLIALADSPVLHSPAAGFASGQGGSFARHHCLPGLHYVNILA